MAELDFPTLRYLLQKFLPDERLIRAFEQLGDAVNENTDTIEIVRAIAADAYFLGFSAAANQMAPAPDMLLCVPTDVHASEALLPVPATYGTIRAGDGLTGGGNTGGDVELALELVTAAGVYTPTLTNVANLDASTAYECQYMRVGDVVTVSGQADLDPTGAGVATRLGISLPIASNLTANSQCAGTGAALGAEAGGIYGDTGSDRAELWFTATRTGNNAFLFSFTYRVI